MELVRGRKKDLPAMISLVDQAKDYFKENGIDQWQDGYPNEESLLEDIELGNAYILKEGDRVVAMLAAIFDKDETYDKIYEGKWLTKEENYLVVHRVAVDSSRKGEGLAKKMLEELEELARKKGRKSIRIDTHKDNKSMIRLIEKSGFRYCGIIYLLDGDSRLAFEKIL